MLARTVNLNPGPARESRFVVKTLEARGEWGKAYLVRAGGRLTFLETELGFI